MRIIRPVTILVLAAQTLWNIPLCAEQRAFHVPLKKSSLKVTLEFDSGHEDWADYAQEQIAFYLPLAERFLKQPFPQMGGIIVRGCEECTAFRQDKRIQVSYSSTHSDSPSLLFHELNHFWFYYYSTSRCQDWLIEGIVSFLPTALRERGLLPDTYEYDQAVSRWWGFNWLPPDEAEWRDRPLCPFDESMRTMIYSKSYRLQYLIYHLVRPSRYSRFLRRYQRLARHDNASVIKLLNSFSRKNWRRLLRGWVLHGSYSMAEPSSFARDGDSDGLSDGEEYARQTGPLSWDTDGDQLADGTEAQLRRDPLVFDADSAALMPEHGPFADGRDPEWKYFQHERQTDVIGDSGGGAWADMTDLDYFFGGGKLHLLVKTAEQIEKEAAVFFDVLIDLDGDGAYDKEFAFYLSDPQNPWCYTPATSESGFVEGLSAGAAEVIEISIPLSAIGAPSFSMLPIIRSDASKTNYDEWDTWVAAASGG